MPTTAVSVPQLKKHRSSGRAYVRVEGQFVYLGRYGTAAAREAYDRWIAEWLSAGRRMPAADDDGLTVAEVIAAFWRHAKVHYRRADGTPTPEINPMRSALRPLKSLYGRTPAADFGPLALKAVRGEMVRLGWRRKSINRQVRRVIHVFGWAESEELLPGGGAARLREVRAIQRGRTEAVESKPVMPADPAAVELVQAHVAPTVAAMIAVQLLTAARPGEVCDMRPSDIDRSGPVWTYRPAQHKSAHHGHDRTVFVGPKAQAVLLPYLDAAGDDDAPVFCPANAAAEQRQARTANRVTPRLMRQPPRHQPRRRSETQARPRLHRADVPPGDHPRLRGCRRRHVRPQPTPPPGRDRHPPRARPGGGTGHPRPQPGGRDTGVRRAGRDRRRQGHRRRRLNRRTSMSKMNELAPTRRIELSPAVYQYLLNQHQNHPELWEQRPHVLLALCEALTLAMRTARELLAEDHEDGPHVYIPGEGDLGEPATQRLMLALIRPVVVALQVGASLSADMPAEARHKRLNQSTAKVIQAALIWAEKEGYATHGETVAGRVRGLHYAALDELRKGNGPLPPDAGSMSSAAGIAGIERLIRHFGDPQPATDLVETVAGIGNNEASLMRHLAKSPRLVFVQASKVYGLAGLENETGRAAAVALHELGLLEMKRGKRKITDLRLNDEGYAAAANEPQIRRK